MDKLRQTLVPIDAILLLGGDLERETLTAELAAGFSKDFSGTGMALEDRVLRALADPCIPIFISSGHGHVEEIFISKGVDPDRIRLDTRATDTVTNYTTMVPNLRRAGFRHIAVITSDYHRQRSDQIAWRVFAAFGMLYTLCGLPSNAEFGKNSPESYVRRWRDVIRIWLWLLCGIELSFLGRFIHPERFWHRAVSAFQK
jgi:uncharacterized SAM-binding protein YcdF (DUF218 family)